MQQLGRTTEEVGRGREKRLSVEGEGPLFVYTSPLVPVGVTNRDKRGPFVSVGNTTQDLFSQLVTPPRTKG
jgi:hypothetical protein